MLSLDKGERAVVLNAYQDFTLELRVSIEDLLAEAFRLAKRGELLEAQELLAQSDILYNTLTSVRSYLECIYTKTVTLH